MDSVQSRAVGEFLSSSALQEGRGGAQEVWWVVE